MQRRAYGPIVNFRRLAVRLHLKGEAAYVAAEAAEALTQALAGEPAEFAIT